MGSDYVPTPDSEEAQQVEAFVRDTFGVSVRWTEEKQYRGKQVGEGGAVLSTSVLEEGPGALLSVGVHEVVHSMGSRGRARLDSAWKAVEALDAQGLEQMLTEEPLAATAPGAGGQVGSLRSISSWQAVEEYEYEGQNMTPLMTARAGITDEELRELLAGA